MHWLGGLAGFGTGLVVGAALLTPLLIVAWLYAPAPRIAVGVLAAVTILGLLSPVHLFPGSLWRVPREWERWGLGRYAFAFGFSLSAGLTMWPTGFVTLLASLTTVGSVATIIWLAALTVATRWLAVLAVSFTTLLRKEYVENALPTIIGPARPFLHLWLILALLSIAVRSLGITVS